MGWGGKKKEGAEGITRVGYMQNEQERKGEEEKKRKGKKEELKQVGRLYTKQKMK